LLVTSGLGGGFPVGYPVGTVARVHRDPAQSLAEVDVRPAAALDRSRELMFVWLKPSPAPAAGAAPPTSAAPAVKPAQAAATPSSSSGAGTTAKAAPKNTSAKGAGKP
jgi:rod shape-determining protein MreC